MKNGDIRQEISPGRLRSFRDTRTVDALPSWPPREKGAANGAAIWPPRQQDTTNGAAATDTRTSTYTKRHTATRRLCAGTYLNRQFRERLLVEIYNCRKRRVAPSYGFDLTQVLRYGWRAWRLELARDAIAVVLLIIAMLTQPLATLLVGGLLSMCYALCVCWGGLMQWVRMLREGKSYDRVKGGYFRAGVASYWLLGTTIVVAGAVLALHLSPQGSWLRGDLSQAGLLIVEVVLLFVTTGAFRHWQLVRLHHISPRRHCRRRIRG